MIEGFFGVLTFPFRDFLWYDHLASIIFCVWLSQKYFWGIQNYLKIRWSARTMRSIIFHKVSFLSLGVIGSIYSPGDFS